MKRNNTIPLTNTAEKETKEVKEDKEQKQNKNEQPGIMRQCVNILKTDEIRKEIKGLFAPIGELILNELHPYVYIIFSLIGFFIIFMFLILILLIVILYKISFFPVLLTSNIRNIISSSINECLGNYQITDEFLNGRVKDCLDGIEEGIYTIYNKNKRKCSGGGGIKLCRRGRNGCAGFERSCDSE